ncbi:unnamed protein product [Microthlaspi erraticum]|uniref:MATH domain-containing protein n=1 Tax=Microthlaspi erraticum TaxID=1685480 RepID=A0A6D2IUE2_9BRAS|nr:unnamed protein product [Microthlaspi erraticum]
MESQKQTSFTFEIDNFSGKKGLIRSPIFSSGGCKWYVKVHPKGNLVDDHLALYLCVSNPGSLRLGWKRLASFSFVLLNESAEELLRNPESSSLFCAQVTGWGTSKAVPLEKLQEKGFLEKNKLIVKVEVKVVEVVDQGDATGNEKFDSNGFQVLYSQAVSVTKLFTEQPDIALNLRLKNQSLKTTCMNILLGLIETMDKPPHDISETELRNAQDDLIELTEAGFKLDWLKTKLDEVEKKKSNVQVQKLEEQIKKLTLELNKEKGKADTCAARVLSLEKTVSDFKDGALDLINEVLEHTVLDLKEELLDLNKKLNKEKEESYTCAAKVMSLEQTVMNLKDELNKEKGKSDTCAVKVLSFEQTVLNMRAELNNEKGKSDTSAAKVLSLEQTVSDLKEELKKERHESYGYVAKVILLEETAVMNLEEVLNKEKGKSDTSAAKVLSLEQTVWDLEDELNKEKDESDTLEQTVLNLKAELNKEKAAACSWEVLDYEDLHKDK